MNRSDIPEKQQIPKKARGTMDAVGEKKKKRIQGSDDESVDREDDEEQTEPTVVVVPKHKDAPAWAIMHTIPQHHSQCGTIGPCDRKPTIAAATLPPRRRFNVRDQLQAAAKSFTLVDLGFEKDATAEPEDVNRSVSCYGFVTLGARLMAHTNTTTTKVSSSSPPTTIPSARCILTLPPVSARGPLANTSVPTIKSSNFNTILLSDVFGDVLLATLLENLSATIHDVPLNLYLRANRITEVATTGSSSADTPNQPLKDVLQKYVIAALEKDSEIIAGGQGGDEHILYWEFTGFSVSVLGQVDRIHNHPTATATLLTFVSTNTIPQPVNPVMATLTEGSTKVTHPAIMNDVVAVRSPVVVDGAGNTTAPITPAPITTPKPPTIPLAAVTPSPKERPHISTPDLIDGKTSRLVKELKEIQDLRDLRGNSNGGYLMQPGHRDSNAHLRRVSPLLNRLKDNAKAPVPDNCAYKSIIDTHRGRLLAPHSREAAGGGETSSPLRQESPPRGGLFSTMWANRTNNTSADGGGGRSVYDAVDANQTYPSASTTSSRRAVKGSTTSTNVSPSRYQRTTPHHPGHTSGDGSIGTPQRVATKSGGTTSASNGDSSRLSKLVNNLNGGSS